MASVSSQILLDAVGLQAPVSLGSSAVSAGVVSSFTMTTTAAIAAGDLVVLAIVCDTAANAVPASVSDGTNTYTQAAIETSTHFSTSIWYKENAAAVAASATITVTLNIPTTGSGNGLAIGAARAVTVATASSLDQTAISVSSAATTTTATTSALSQMNEIVFGASLDNTSGATYSGASGFTNILTVAVPGSNGTFALDYKITASVSAVSFVPVWVGSGLIEAVVATFKGR